MVKREALGRVLLNKFLGHLGKSRFYHIAYWDSCDTACGNDASLGPGRGGFRIGGLVREAGVGGAVVMSVQRGCVGLKWQARLHRVRRLTSLLVPRHDMLSSRYEAHC